MDQLDQLLHGKPQVTAPAAPMLDDSATVEDDDTTTVDDQGTDWARAKANTVLKQQIASRMIAAREMNGLGQTQAALLIGWKNATQLSLIEQGKRMPPHTLMIRISAVLGVSLDWLFGLDDEPERDSRSAAVKASVRQINRMLERNAMAVCTALHESHRVDTAQAIRSTKVVSRVTTLCEAVNRFREIDPMSFDEKRGSATLLYVAKEALESIGQVCSLLDQSVRRTEFALRHGREAMKVNADCVASD